VTVLTLRVFRGVGDGDGDGDGFHDYRVEVAPGMVVLDVIHRLQATQAPDLACRWNCKAGKCGSCSAEVDGRPRLLCMTRMDEFEPDRPITVAPLRAFPLVRDLVADVGGAYRKLAEIPPLRARAPDPDGVHRMQQRDIERVQEFHSCIECLLCLDVCHVLRDHDLEGDFFGPRHLVAIAARDMHPLDVDDRAEFARLRAGIDLCNVTKCCTEVCPEGVHITDNAIIPIKERIADGRDPLIRLARRIGPRRRPPPGARP
jgi:succinate dehydrogenase / fumarate reductase, iron-sulfur subunit